MKAIAGAVLVLSAQALACGGQSASPRDGGIEGDATVDSGREELARLP